MQKDKYVFPYNWILAVKLNDNLTIIHRPSRLGKEEDFKWDAWMSLEGEIE